MLPNEFAYGMHSKDRVPKFPVVIYLYVNLFFKQKNQKQTKHFVKKSGLFNAEIWWYQHSLQYYW